MAEIFGCGRVKIYSKAPEAASDHALASAADETSLELSSAGTCKGAVSAPVTEFAASGALLFIFTFPQLLSAGTCKGAVAVKDSS